MALACVYSTNAISVHGSAWLTLVTLVNTVKRTDSLPASTKTESVIYYTPLQRLAKPEFSQRLNAHFVVMGSGYVGNFRHNNLLFARHQKSLIRYLWIVV